MPRPANADRPQVTKVVCNCADIEPCPQGKTEIGRQCSIWVEPTPVPPPVKVNVSPIPYLVIGVLAALLILFMAHVI